MGSFNVNGDISYKENYHGSFPIADNYKFLDDKLVITERVPAAYQYCCSCIRRGLTLDDNYYYVLQFIISLDSLKLYLRDFILLSVLLFLVCALLSLILSLWLSKKISDRLNLANQKVMEIIKSEDFKKRLNIFGNDEVSDLSNNFDRLISELYEKQEQNIELQKTAVISEMAARVAHDIRSPLSIMEIGLQTLPKDIARNKIAMLQAAVQSIRDIANNLLEHYRNPAQTMHQETCSIKQDDGNLSRPLLLYSLIEQAISQKRFEWQSKNVEFIFTYSQESKSAWVELAPNHLDRLLSNLLNNSCEALINGGGTIKIDLQCNNTFLRLSIEDNGHGIPEDKIHTVLGGLSLKHQGKGIGLSSAQQYMSSIHGELQLTSQENSGTIVTLLFHSSDRPSWFTQKIEVLSRGSIMVLDDDVAMRMFWKNRFQNVTASLHIFSNYQDAIDWYGMALNKNNISYIVDYELTNTTKNGLNFLGFIKQRSRAYLTTSHAEEIFIQQEVAALSVFLIPKILLSEISIEEVNTD